MVNKNLLLSKIVLQGLTWLDLADKLGVYSSTLHAKLRGTRDFKSSEIKKIIELCNLTPDEVMAIFFSDVGVS